MRQSIFVANNKTLLLLTICLSFRYFMITQYELKYFANEDQRVLKGTVPLELCTRAESVENGALLLLLQYKIKGFFSFLLSLSLSLSLALSPFNSNAIQLSFEGTFSDHKDFVFQLSYVDKIGPCTLYMQAMDFDQRLQWLTTLRTTLHTIEAKPRSTYHPGVLSRIWSCCGLPENKANQGSSGCTRATSWVPGAAGATAASMLLTPQSSPGRRRSSKPAGAGGAAMPPGTPQTPGGGRNANISMQDVGCRVVVAGYDCEGTLRYVGKHHEKGTRKCGVELDEPAGNNNGTVKGYVYFTCPAQCGLLINPSKVTKVPPKVLAVPGVPEGEASDDEWEEADYMARYRPTKVTLTRVTGSFGVRFVGPKELENIAAGGRGLYLSDSAPRSPAEEAGLQCGLRVIALNGVFLAKAPLRTLSALLGTLQQSLELVVVTATAKYEQYQRQAALDLMATGAKGGGSGSGGGGGGGEGEDGGDGAAARAAAAQAEREASWAPDVESGDEWEIEDYEANCEVTVTTLSKPDGMNVSGASFGVVFRGVTEPEDHLICGHGLYIVRLIKGSLAEESDALHVGQRVLSMDGNYLAKKTRPV